MNLRPRGRHRGRAAPMPPPAPGSTAAPFLALSSDSIRASLHLLRDSADVFPPLKSAVGGVLAVWDLADRVSTSDDNAQALAWRAVGILDAIYNAVGGADSGSVSPGMLQEILKFEQLLREISAAMKGQLKAGRFRRVLHLRRHESQLAGFTSRLDAAAEAFKIGSSTRVELVVNRVELAISLRGEVQRLRAVVLFGLPPVFHGYSQSERGCTVTPPLAISAEPFFTGGNPHRDIGISNDEWMSRGDWKEVWWQLFLSFWETSRFYLAASLWSSCTPLQQLYNSCFAYGLILEAYRRNLKVPPVMQHCGPRRTTKASKRCSSPLGVLSRTRDLNGVSLSMPMSPIWIPSHALERASQIPYREDGALHRSSALSTVVKPYAPFRNSGSLREPRKNLLQSRGRRSVGETHTGSRPAPDNQRVSPSWALLSGFGFDLTYER
ncbi:hypothetical protein DFH09DRAFT_1421460 [Mycena vulgaris]|nr:hypothetical protein DFH09DRAFT_1421460 [Mycena vulgaris]